MSLLEKTCHYCNRSAKSGYIRYDDGTICCVNCKEHYPACSRCSKPAKQHITQDDQVVCTDCVKDLHRCGICQKFLLEKAYKIGEARYCIACYNGAEKCAACGAPLSPEPPAPAQPGADLPAADAAPKAPPIRICKACYERVAKCSFCGKPIMSHAWKNDSESILACVDCYPKADRCSKCGAPLRAPRYVRGKLYCAACNPNQPKPAPAPAAQKDARTLPQARAATGKQHTFLVVSPTNTYQLKAEKESLLVNNCLKNYHEFVKKNVAENRGIVVSVSEEKILCLFDLSEDAVRAAEAIVKGVANFNRQFNKLSVQLHLHVGLNSIEKSVSGADRVESLYGSVTDLAYKVLNVADPDTVVITEQTFQHLGDTKTRFVKHKKISDLHLSVSTYRLQ